MSLQYLIDAYKFKYVLNPHDEQILVSTVKNMTVEERGILAEFCLSIIKLNPNEDAIERAYNEGYQAGEEDIKCREYDGEYDRGYSDGYRNAKHPD